MTKAIHLIKADGTVEVFDKSITLKNLQVAVGGMIEHVKVLDRIESDAHGDDFIYTSMYVDDEGLLKGKPHNEKATEIYLRNAREQIKRGVSAATFGSLENLQVVGDVLHFPGYTCDEVNDLYVPEGGEHHA